MAATPSPLSCYRCAGWWWSAAAALPVWGLMAMIWPVQPALPTPRWWLLVLFWPVLEELVFRGGIVAALRERDWGRWRLLGVSAANAIAALLFALAHLFAHAPVWAASVFVPGLLFGYWYERGGLMAAIGLHVWFNAGYFTLYPPGA